MRGKTAATGASLHDLDGPAGFPSRQVACFKGPVGQQVVPFRVAQYEQLGSCRLVQRSPACELLPEGLSICSAALIEQVLCHPVAQSVKHGAHIAEFSDMCEIRHVIRRCYDLVDVGVCAQLPRE